MILPTRPLTVATRGIAAALRPPRPLLVQIVVTRRCNLACGYCNEYDDVSAPVPREALQARIDKAGSLGTFIVCLTGGEPLLHPELDRLVAHAVERGMMCSSITNGYALTRTWIDRLNRGGLALLQVSVDNLEPNARSQKSWVKIRPKLELLREHARFEVNVNAVLGACPPEETRQLATEVRQLGFYMTFGVMHDGRGQVTSALVGDDLGTLYEELAGSRRKSFLHRVGEGWEAQMIRDGVAPFRCRAGARYLYVDEHGIVSYCSQRRGEPGIPLLDYGAADLARGFNHAKGCEASCTLACVRRASALDQWRPQLPELAPTPGTTVRLVTLGRSAPERANGPRE